MAKSLDLGKQIDELKQKRDKERMIKIHTEVIEVLKNNETTLEEAERVFSAISMMNTAKAKSKYLIQ